MALTNKTKLRTTVINFNTILANPASGSLDPVFWSDYPWIFIAGGWATLLLELSAPLILTRWCRWWALAGVILHLGIASVMHLGMFAWGMLALYPVLFSPWTERALDWVASKRAKGFFRRHT